MVDVGDWRLCWRSVVDTTVLALCLSTVWRLHLRSESSWGNVKAVAAPKDSMERRKIVVGPGHRGLAVLIKGRPDEIEGWGLAESAQNLYGWHAKERRVGEARRSREVVDLGRELRESMGGEAEEGVLCCRRRQRFVWILVGICTR